MGGFFYASARKSSAIQGLFQAVVSEVDLRLRRQGKGGADQPIWWELFNSLRRTKGERCGDFPCGGFRCVKMCGRGASCKAPAAVTLEFCAMDPHSHPTGWE